jgi:CheY-like chemotaxis protein
VLVIDDDARIRDGSAALLASWGCVVTAAATPAQALATRADVDVVLADLDLGDDSDGIDLIGALRARDPGIVCALVTADRSVATLARCAAEGVALLAKPVDPALLADWLANAGVRSAVMP